MHSIWNPGEWHINSKFAWKCSFVETQTCSPPFCFYYSSPKTSLQNVGVASLNSEAGPSPGWALLMPRRRSASEICKKTHLVGESKPARLWAINQPLLILCSPEANLHSELNFCQSLFWKGLKSTGKRLTVNDGSPRQAPSQTVGTPSHELRLAYKSPIPKRAQTKITFVFIERQTQVLTCSVWHVIHNNTLKLVLT